MLAQFFWICFPVDNQAAVEDGRIEAVENTFKVTTAEFHFMLYEFNRQCAKNNYKMIRLYNHFASLPQSRKWGEAASRVR
jgi:hypothetical protein